jgi:hypothetical protein
MRVKNDKKNIQIKNNSNLSIRTMHVSLNNENYDDSEKKNIFIFLFSYYLCVPGYA